MWTSVLIVVKSGVPMAALNLRRPLKYRLMLKYSVLELFLKRSRPQKVLNLAGASKMSDGSRIKADSNRLNIYCLVVQYIVDCGPFFSREKAENCVVLDIIYINLCVCVV